MTHLNAWREQLYVSKQMIACSYEDKVSPSTGSFYKTSMLCTDGHAQWTEASTQPYECHDTLHAVSACMAPSSNGLPVLWAVP